jgi:hypothetical protein
MVGYIAVMGADEPAFQEGGNPVDAGEMLRRGVFSFVNQRCWRMPIAELLERA